MDPLPLCGAPPRPGEAGWNLDPFVLAALALGLGAAWRCAVPGRRGAALAGWAVVAAALVSPLCSLSVALFTARSLQHVLLLLVAAPLLAWACCGAGARPRGLGMAAAGFAAALWAWHLPGPYAATFPSHAAWWAMHLSLLGTAIWLWHGLLAAARAAPHQVLLSGCATAAQMALLGAFVTLSPRALYAPHTDTTLAWGLTQMEDQQLGGLLMWVPGGLVAVALLALFLAPVVTAASPPPRR
jgi:putative membrane protein